MTPDHKWLVAGGIVAAICCLTPILVVLLAGLGVSWAVGDSGYVAVGAFVLLLGAAAYAGRRFWRYRASGRDERC